MDDSFELLKRAEVSITNRDIDPFLYSKTEGS